MRKQIDLKLLPSEAASDSSVANCIAKTLSIKKSYVKGFQIIKRNIDARGKQIWINITVLAYINEPFQKIDSAEFNFKEVINAKFSVLIIGAGPAGLFAALKLLEHGIKPVILERGKDVRARRRDIATLNKDGIINPESNYCFGEGGAGTFSDGKLYTRSSKRGNIRRILDLFEYFGADKNILYESHPHIGTNKLPQIITTIREQIKACGGEFKFEKKVVDLETRENHICAVITADGDRFSADAIILATGHSARDIFRLLCQKKILIEAKPFALGVRVEHPQSLIDSIQYHCKAREEYLPPASYSLVEQVNSRGVFSFCMCPGGIIAPASTNQGELVVNGWSPSKRNNVFANSGVVVQLQNQDMLDYMDYEDERENPPGSLLGMHFQQAIERKAYLTGGGNFVAPAQRLVDFCENKVSTSLPQCSYLPGVSSADLSQVLPFFIHQPLQLAFKKFGKKMRGYFTNEAIVVAVESRTSSPVRIPRDATNLQHPQLENFYPCGEGAGYAGGIVSAAMDGEKIASAIIEKLNATNPHK